LNQPFGCRVAGRVDRELRHHAREIEYLQSSIGRTGLLALKPLQITSGRDLWHRHPHASGGVQPRG
jgi:hypothetical protein